MNILAAALVASSVAFSAEDESAFLKNVRQLTFEGKRSGEGYFSPDGKSLIFQSEREADNPFYQIYIMDLESGDAHRELGGVADEAAVLREFERVDLESLDSDGAEDENDRPVEI